MREEEGHTGKDVMFLAIADDVFMLGLHDDIVPAFATLKHELSVDGLELQGSKTAFYSNSSNALTQVGASIAAGRLEGRTQADGMVVSGVPISNKRQFVEDFVKDRVERYCQLSMFCVQLPPSEAFRAFRDCVKPMWDHLHRSGTTLGLTGSGTFDKLERLSQVIGDYASNFNSRMFEKLDD